MATVPIVTEKTYAEMAALIAASELNLALSYKITDRGDRGLLFRAAAPNRLESDGLRYMLCPATYATGEDAYSNSWIGVWNATKQATATEGQLTIWNGLVWVAGATLSGDSPSTEASGWTVIPKASFTNHEYVEMIFGVDYDFDNDWINKQWDANGNIHGISLSVYLYDFYNEGDYVNFVDYCDWNYASSDSIYYGNKTIACYNNSNSGDIYGNDGLKIIANNSNNGNISYNKLNDDIVDNSNNGHISYNSISGSIAGNSILGNIFNNHIIGDISYNSSLAESVVVIYNNGDGTGSITGVWDADVTDAVVDKIGTAE